MITADQLVAHAIGDYVLQSDWMANKKRTENVAAMAHAIVYTLCFIPLAFETTKPLPVATFVIFYSHFLIDRYGLARYVVWAKNFLAPPSETCSRLEFWILFGVWIPKPLLSFRECAATGYPPDRPPFLAVWLLIICDNCLHVVLNGLALRYL